MVMIAKILTGGTAFRIFQYWADGSQPLQHMQLKKMLPILLFVAIKRENTWFEPEYSESEYTNDGTNVSVPGSMGRDTAGYWVAAFNEYEEDDSADWKQAFEDLSDQIFPYDTEATQGEGALGSIHDDIYTPYIVNNQEGLWSGRMHLRTRYRAGIDFRAMEIILVGISVQRNRDLIPRIQFWI